MQHMSVEAVRTYFEKWPGMEARILEFPVSSATVAEAALAVGTQEQRIAKTLSFLLERGPILVVAAGDAKVDNKKFKAAFHKKASMLKADELTELIGHPAGGVCPFAVRRAWRSIWTSRSRDLLLSFPPAGAPTAPSSCPSRSWRCTAPALTAGWMCVRYRNKRYKKGNVIHVMTFLFYVFRAS